VLAGIYPQVSSDPSQYCAPSQFYNYRQYRKLIEELSAVSLMWYYYWDLETESFRDLGLGILGTIQMLGIGYWYWVLGRAFPDNCSLVEQSL